MSTSRGPALRCSRTRENCDGGGITFRVGVAWRGVAWRGVAWCAPRRRRQYCGVPTQKFLAQNGCLTVLDSKGFACLFWGDCIRIRSSELDQDFYRCFLGFLVQQVHKAIHTNKPSTYDSPSPPQGRAPKSHANHVAPLLPLRVTTAYSKMRSTQTCESHRRRSRCHPIH